MPELPDITIYLEALEKRILHTRLQRVQLASPFLLRTAAPPISAVEGKEVVELRRLGKRICLGFDDCRSVALERTSREGRGRSPTVFRQTTQKHAGNLPLR